MRRRYLTFTRWATFYAHTGVVSRRRTYATTRGAGHHCTTAWTGGFLRATCHALSRADGAPHRRLGFLRACIPILVPAFVGSAATGLPHTPETYRGAARIYRHTGVRCWFPLRGQNW